MSLIQPQPHTTETAGGFAPSITGAAHSHCPWHCLLHYRYCCLRRSYAAWPLGAAVEAGTGTVGALLGRRRKEGGIHHRS